MADERRSEPRPLVAEDLWQRADELLDEALDLPAGQRPPFLDRACGDNRQLRGLVERLISAAEIEDPEFKSGGALQGPLGDRIRTELAEEESLAGAMVGRYRIVRELGRGGMAVVYLAERADGQFRQEVALKLLSAGLVASHVGRRFDRERQILAHARHPGVARLLDGGAGPSGRPYLVMEYVDGRPIDRYCDEEKLGVEARLDLFLQVARVVEDAHRNLIVHRDIKPSNILVTAEGHAKLLDFGIAKLLDPEATSSGDAPVSGSAIRLMTPAYASPEQVRGNPVTTASDIYQLGLLLYILLTGRFPYDLGDGDPAERMRAIVQREPVRPSTAAASPEGWSPPGHGPRTPGEIAYDRGTTPARLRRALSGDLDAILCRALGKEPESRYASVSQLIEDLERHKIGRAVLARPDTWAYRTGKLIRRHAAVFATAAIAVLLVVALGLVYTAGLARERDHARQEAAREARVSEFLRTLFVVPPGAGPLTPRQILDRAVARVDLELRGEPEAQSDLLALLAGMYRDLGLTVEARALQARSDELAVGDSGNAKNRGRPGPVPKDTSKE
ncbi:MAG: serine/threonine-protein kinase [Acidobacteriota bacterium]